MCVFFVRNTAKHMVFIKRVELLHYLPSCPSGALFRVFGEGFPFKLNQPNKSDADVIFWHGNPVGI